MADSKKKVDEDQVEIEEMQGIKRKLDKEIESLHERIEELTAENQKTARSKKKIQGEVRHTASLHIVKEAICIWTTPESSHFNCNSGYDISDCWITTYWKLRGGTRASHIHPSTS